MKKVTDEELKEIQALRETLMEIVTLIGEQHLNKFVLSSQLEAVSAEIKKLEERFSEFQTKERVLFEKLQNTYGTGNISMETGEITE